MRRLSCVIRCSAGLVVLAAGAGEHGPSSIAAAASSMSAAQEIRRCVVDGKLLDLTAAGAKPGRPPCVARCAEGAVPTIQAEGVAFCLRPVCRSAPLDVAFTLSKLSVDWTKLPSPDQLQSHVFMTLAQALQVAPGDVQGEMLVRDADLYDGERLVSIRLQRRDGKDMPLPPMTEEERQAVVLKEQRRKQELKAPAAPEAANATLSEQANKDDDIQIGQHFRNAGAGVAKANDVAMRHGPQAHLLLPCRRCDVHLSIRFESWRECSDKPEDAGAAHPRSRLLQALHDLDSAATLQALGLPDDWTLLEARAGQLPGWSPEVMPLEAVGTRAMLRYKEHEWNIDPLFGNMTANAQRRRGGLGSDEGFPPSTDQDVVMQFVEFFALITIVMIGMLYMVLPSGQNGSSFWPDGDPWSHRESSFSRSRPVRMLMRKGGRAVSAVLNSTVCV
eukprot:TRINITY_DN49171_c0_g1_i1.p1 TRINITY_DN49171_c0_g1~~TRINITY_DN49171_c0_g1_i1.p1  ORF type:complete len:446 (-),score=99.73 TRINITY_DN49171_c0_g1_i1:78-1415(-)